MFDYKGLYEMMRVRFMDGLEVCGETYEDVCQRLWMESRDEAETLDEFLASTQRAVKLQTGQPIFFSDCRSFIAELQRVNIITEIQEGAV